MQNRDEILKEYFKLVDDADYQSNIKDGDTTLILDQVGFMNYHKITRHEIDQFKKRGTQRFNNFNDAKAALSKMF